MGLGARDRGRARVGLDLGGRWGLGGFVVDDVLVVMRVLVGVVLREVVGLVVVQEVVLVGAAVVAEVAGDGEDDDLGGMVAVVAVAVMVVVGSVFGMHRRRTMVDHAGVVGCVAGGTVAAGELEGEQHCQREGGGRGDRMVGAHGRLLA